MSPKVNISPESLKEKLESLLKTMTEGTIAAGDLDKYYEVEAALNLADGDSMVTMDKVFGRLVGSIQNRSMMPNVIKYWKHPQVFDNVLCGHSPQKVLDAYGDAGELYKSIRCNWPKEEKPLETEMKGLWKQWCEGVLSAARFLNGFNNVEELRKGFYSIYHNVWARPALPALLAMEISGIRIASETSSPLRYILCSPSASYFISIRSVGSRDLIAWLSFRLIPARTAASPTVR